MNRQRAEDMLVATSRAMQETVAAARQIAQGREPVLVDGETGAGRRLLARFLHEQSPRDRQPVVYVRCDTLTVDATDRILFGDPACGAAGILEQLGDGTLALCDLEDLCPVAQEKLAEVFANGEYVTASGDKRKVTCRVVATGNRAALEEQVRYGRFSMDLLQWLSQSELRMPSLSERREDIPKLVMAILRDFAQREHVAAPSVPYHYMELLMTVSWPENVRQLRNHVESVIALSNGVFDPEIIREHFQPAASSATIKGALHMLWNKLRGASAAPSLNHN